MENGCHCHHDDDNNKSELILSILGIVVYVVTFILVKCELIQGMLSVLLYVISYILLGYEIVINAVKKILKKDMFDENFLMSIATIGALIIGEYEEAIAVLLFYKVGEFLQDLAVEKSEEKIKAAIDVRPDYANLYKDGKEMIVSPDQVNLKDIIIVKNGEKIPLDGVIVEGKTIIDNSALTGESKPVEVEVGTSVNSGCINLGSVVKVEVTKNYENSTVYKLVKMTTDAIENKSNTEKFITKFAKIYTPIVTFLALVIFLILPLVSDVTFRESAFRALSFLVVSCPCALVISIPLGFFVGVGISSKNDILVKGTNFLDMMSNVKKVVFDKTGTLTNGVFEISDKKVCCDNITEEELLEYIAYAESYSNHHLAKSILNCVNLKVDKTRVTEYNEIAGMGIEVKIDNKDVLVGNESLMKKYDIKFNEVKASGTVVHLAVEKVYYGYIILEDSLKESSKNLIDSLKRHGVSKTYLLTGDKKEIAQDIGERLKIDNIYSELLPNDKNDILKKIKTEDNGIVAYVGDGINDGPVLALADVGISMGNGSDLAVETSDVVILNNNLGRIIDLIKISKRTKRIVMQNIVVILCVKVLFLILSGFGISNMWQAVFADVGVSLICILNSLRIYNYKTK